MAWVADAERAADVGVTLVKLFGMARTRTTNRSGQWISNDTLIAILGAYENVDAGQCPVDVSCTHLAEGQQIGSDTELSRFTRDAAVVVCDTDRDHYFCIYVDIHAKRIHAFDTLFERTPQEVARVLRRTFPKAALMGFKLQNHTSLLRQEGATCGAWTLWIIVAMSLNVNNCRSDARALKLTPDVVGFYKAVTR